MPSRAPLSPGAGRATSVEVRLLADQRGEALPWKLSLPLAHRHGMRARPLPELCQRLLLLRAARGGNRSWSAAGAGRFRRRSKDGSGPVGSAGLGRYPPTPASCPCDSSALSAAFAVMLRPPFTATIPSPDWRGRCHRLRLRSPDIGGPMPSRILSLLRCHSCSPPARLREPKAANAISIHPCSLVRRARLPSAT